VKKLENDFEQLRTGFAASSFCLLHFGMFNYIETGIIPYCLHFTRHRVKNPIIDMLLFRHIAIKIFYFRFREINFHLKLLSCIRGNCNNESNLVLLLNPESSKKSIFKTLNKNKLYSKVGVRGIATINITFSI
jgi:hypothetical protein